MTHPATGNPIWRDRDIGGTPITAARLNAIEDLLDAYFGGGGPVGGLLRSVNNLNDVADATASRTNLGLGDSATKNVGTTTGTVAAGNDSRFTDGSNGHTILDEGSSLTRRPTLNFIGANVTATDNSGSNRTDVTISGGSSTGPHPFLVMGA